MEAKRFLVTGRVQGVFFRASTRKEAQRLDIRGSAVNLPDGRVEVLALGSAQALQNLHEWLQHGPQLARVEEVAVESLDPDALAGQADFSCG